MAAIDNTAPGRAQFRSTREAAATRAAALVREALGHARLRDRWMRRARERRPVPFLADEVGHCVRYARDENRALLHIVRLLAKPTADAWRAYKASHCLESAL